MEALDSEVDIINLEKAFKTVISGILTNKSTKAAEAANPPSKGILTSRSSGDNEPAHYILKIESFSILSEAGIAKYESDVFEAAGHRWRLDLYPNGYKDEDGGNHISLYLVICDTESLPKGWDVHVYLKFLVYDHVRHNYLTIQGADGKRRRFHEAKTKWGFPKLISLDSFKDALNGYLFQDSCVFGAEVFAVSKYAEKDQCLSMIKIPTTINTYTWRIDGFSAITEESLCSEDFKVGKVKWKLSLYPKGINSGSGTHLSMYLKVHDAASLPDDWKFYAKFKLRVKNQTGSTDEERETEHWFCNSADDWGFGCLMSLKDLNDLSKGFLLKDTLIVEVVISFVGMLKNNI